MSGFASAKSESAQASPRSGKALHEELLNSSRQVAAICSAEAVNTEAAGTLAPAAVEALRDTQLFWCLTPREVGGLGCELVTAIEIVEELTRADGSSGWSLMANALATAMAGAFCPDEGVEVIFGAKRLPILAGMFGPGGKARAVDNGYQGAGRYSFGSGCAHADWMGGGMFVLDDGGQKVLPSGVPEVRICFVPRERVKFHGNWEVMGLVGTGSYDYEFADQFIPSSFTMERTQSQHLRGGTVFTLGLQAFGCAGHAGVALGLMHRALTEVARISATKKRPGATLAINESPVFRHGFSTHEAMYQAARGFVIEVFADAERTAASGTALSTEQRQRFRQAATWAHKVASEVVSFCHVWGGSDSIRNPSALGRCTRDVYVATQHVFVDQATLVDAAPALLERWAAGPR